MKTIKGKICVDVYELKIAIKYVFISQVLKSLNYMKVRVHIHVISKIVEINNIKYNN